MNSIHITQIEGHVPHEAEYVRLSKDKKHFWGFYKWGSIPLEGDRSIKCLEFLSGLGVWMGSEAPNPEKFVEERLTKIIR